MEDDLVLSGPLHSIEKCDRSIVNSKWVISNTDGIDAADDSPSSAKAFC